MSNYKNVLSPILINGMILKNRIVMPPMGSNFARTTGEVTEDMIRYYEERAKGGTGLITIENACIDFPLATNGTKQLRIDDNQFIPGLHNLVERLHAYDTKVSIQLNHAGASAYAGRLNGLTPVSSSTIPSKTGGQTPRPLTEEEIEEIVEKFAEAADKAKQAGFDSVEIHSGHSYLLCQFISPLFNDRKDKFGGSIENRARFPMMVAKRVREVVGPRYPVSIRVSAEDFLEGGNTLEDSLKLMEYIVEYVDIINVSAAENDNLQYQIDKADLKDGWKSYLGKAFRDKFNKPVIVSGNIRDPKIAEDILVKGDADLLAIGRGLIAEPNWVNKVAGGNEHLLRNCVSCNIGCANNRIGKSKEIRCIVNPSLLDENAHRKVKVKEMVKLAVIGAGTAGMEAAATAAEMGCDVTIYEKDTHVGGLAHDIGQIPAKYRIGGFVKYLENRMKDLDNLEIKLNHQVTKQELEDLEYDVVINATGSKPMLPPIKGLQEFVGDEASKIETIFDFMKKVNEYDKDSKDLEITIVGGGAVGLDVMEFFGERNAKITIVEMMDETGKDLDLITKLAMDELLEKYKVTQLLNTRLEEVKKESFLVKYPNGEEKELTFDHGFVCLGMVPEVSELGNILEHMSSDKYHFLNIGDSSRVGRIIDGTLAGRNIYKHLETLGYLY